MANLRGGRACELDLLHDVGGGRLHARIGRESERELRKQLETVKKQAAETSSAAQAIQAFDLRTAALEGRVPASRGAAAPDDSLLRLSARLTSLFSALSSGDAAPTAQAVAESEELAKTLARRVAEWNMLRTVELSALNEQLRSAGIPPPGLTGRAPG